MAGQRAATSQVRLDRPPAIISSYLRALAKRSARDPDGALPPAGLLLTGVVADPSRLAAYNAVCGYPPGGTLPPAYPHVLAFPAALALMTRRDFPLPVLGLVHVANRITVRRPIAADEPLTLRVSAAGRRADPAGTAFDIVARAAAGQETVWESVSTYLHRGPKKPGTSGRRRAAPPTVDGEPESWPVPADTGRRYAAASGDRNPIHLHALTARLFGFRTAIAHGMWAKARVLAALAPRLPGVVTGAYTVDVTFRAPIPLPSSVRLTSAGPRFALTTPDGRRTHLYGEVKPAD